MLILSDPSMAFKTVALSESVDCATLLPIASETGQESLTLYLILKMPSDPVQGLTFLIRLVKPGCVKKYRQLCFGMTEEITRLQIVSVISC